MTSFFEEQENALVGVAVTLYTYILEGGLGGGGTTAILTGLSWLSSVPPGKCQDITSIRSRPPLPYKSFPINFIIDYRTIRRHVI
jgi:hypothetical protein